MLLAQREILSLVRLPVPPLQLSGHLSSSVENLARGDGYTNGTTRPQHISC